MVLYTIVHPFSPEIQWSQYQMVISTFHQVIKASHHLEESSRRKDKCQSQIPMMPSSNHWLFSFTVFLQGNTGSSFSRDIQEEDPKQPVKGQCSINPPWQPHSFNTVWMHQDLCFIHTPWEFNSTQFISQFCKVYTSSSRQIQLQGFNKDQLSA
ncbi:hypothetical protein O181_000358 [Austropuccinia psidii MF-1]|uniref:Uncharacterized protein n=1 Tax=Austropuccinia psidii MF-1 TaxID=1389203 RepID=A0A9Q3GAT9_9BASI|nr:hypothetical protein [Austropuccinia psidii MF-1]